MSFRSGLFFVLSVILVWGTVSVEAQGGDQTYVDPSGNLSVPVPGDWKDQSTDKFGHFVSSDESAHLWIVVVNMPDLDKAAPAAAKLVGADLSTMLTIKPIGPRNVALPTGTWIQQVYTSSDGIIVVTLGVVKAQSAYFLIFRATADKLNAITAVMNQSLLKLRFLQDETAPPYADPALYTEQEVTISGGGFSLPGTLTMPKGEGPFPAVVLVHGSGPNDRDESLGPNRPFRDLAWGLASNGIAVLRYDKRTLIYGEKSAVPIENLTVKEESMDDALAAAALLRTTAGIDPTKVFILGHSLGGLLTPRITAQDSELAGAIIMAGNTRPLEDLMVIQTSYLAETDGTVSLAEKNQIDIVKKQVRNIKDLTDSQWGEKGLFILGAPAAYWLDLRSYNPVETARKLTQPLLILQGECDYQVTFKEDFQGWKDGLSDRTDVTFKSYAKLNHLFMVGTGTGAGTAEEYAIPGHIPLEVITDISAWIKALS